MENGQIKIKKMFGYNTELIEDSVVIRKSLKRA